MSKYTCTGKVIDICPNCKNCKTVDWDGVSNIECEDPFDGAVKTLTADSNLCCSMFELANGVPVYELKGVKPIEDEQNETKEVLYKTRVMYSVLKEEKEELEARITALLREKAAHLKAIECLKKSQERLVAKNDILEKEKEESYKREEKLEDKVHRLERRLHGELDRARSIDTNFLMPLTRVLYPGEKVGKPYYEILEDVKRLIDKNETLDKRNTNQFVLIGEKDKQFEELTRRYNMLAKKLNDIYVILKEGNEDE